MKELCKKCNGKYGEAFPYHKWPQQWYHGGGKTIFLFTNFSKLKYYCKNQKFDT